MDLSFAILISAKAVYKMRADPLSLDSSVVLVLCLSLGTTYTFHWRRKSKRASKWLGFLVDVWFWSLPDLTLNQWVRTLSLRGPTKTYLMIGLRRLWAERVH